MSSDKNKENTSQSIHDDIDRTQASKYDKNDGRSEQDVVTPPQSQSEIITQASDSADGASYPEKMLQSELPAVTDERASDHDAVDQDHDTANKSAHDNANESASSQSGERPVSVFERPVAEQRRVHEPKSEQERPPQSDSSAAADERLSEHDSAGDPPAATTARIPGHESAEQGRDSADTSTQGATNESASSQMGIAPFLFSSDR